MDRRSPRWPRLLAPCLAVCLLAAGAAQAAPQQTVQVLFPGQGDGTLRDSGPGFVSVMAEYGGLESAVRNLAQARPGMIGVSSTSAGTVASGSATATTTGRYLIEGPGQQVTGSLNLSLDGLLGVEGGQFSPSAGATIELQYSFGPASSGSFSATISKSAGTSEPRLSFTGTAGVPNPFEAGELGPQGLVLNGLFTTPAVTLPVGTLITFQLRATARSSLGASGLPDEFGGAHAEFGHTFSLALDQDVFNLPSGFTVQSQDLGIVDNRFLPMPVPEPASALLLVLGLGALLGLRRA